MKERKEILAIPATAEELKLYGELVVPHTNTELDFGSGTPTLDIRSIPYRDFVFNEMSRHIHCCQVFFPLNGKDFLIAVAPPSDNNDPFAVPDIKKIKAFVVNGSNAVVLHKGSWHTTPFPFCHKSHIATLQCKKTFEEDLDLKKLNTSILIIFE
jgi:ureidoglycolate hydrolase